MAVRVTPLGNSNIMLSNDAQPGGPIQIYTPEEWTAFIEGVKIGEFDLEALAARCS